MSACENQLLGLHYNDVLFNRTNSFEFVGRTGIFKHEKAAVFASYLIRLVPNEEFVLPEYLTLYLNTEFGIGQIRRRAMPSINQANVSGSELKRILIPLIDIEEQKKMAFMLDEAFSYRLHSVAVYSNARKLLASELGLNALALNTRNTANISFSRLVRAKRFDAEHYRPVCDQVLMAIADKHSMIPLGRLLSLNQRGVQPEYREHGSTAFNSRHVRVNEVVMNRNRRGIVIGGPPLTIQKGDVLINGTGMGTIGRAAPYLSEEPALSDNHVTVLRTTAIDPIYLAAYLNSLPGQLQVHQRGSSGQIELYPADIDKILVWIAPNEVQKKIRDLVVKAREASRFSKEVLQAAKDYVSAAVLQGAA